MGHAPVIGRRADDYAVYLLGYNCPDCGGYISGGGVGYVTASTLDEVLEKAAECAYNARCTCERVQGKKI
jgi:hypothetical protein